MTSLSYSWVLAIAYGSAFGAWLVCERVWPDLWPPADTRIDRPWRQLGWTVLSLGAVLGVGLLYGRGWLLPRVDGLGLLVESINQVLIFSPYLVMLILTRQTPASVWLRFDRVPARIGVGLVLAMIATFVFTLLHADADSWAVVVVRVYATGLDWAVQIFLEDLVIAGLFVRASQAMGIKVALVLTGAAFAAGHLPAIVAGGGAVTPEVLALLRDATLVIVALTVLRRAQDIWWMWMLHFAMDMMQRVSGAQLG